VNYNTWQLVRIEKKEDKEVSKLCLGSISEGGSTKEVLGPDYLGSMLKMETDDYVDAQPMSNAQQPDLLKMCRSR
jgi:hypothetical protein